jgi:hypothetical protein
MCPYRYRALARLNFCATSNWHKSQPCKPVQLSGIPELCGVTRRIYPKNSWRCVAAMQNLRRYLGRISIALTASKFPHKYRCLDQ